MGSGSEKSAAERWRGRVESHHAQSRSVMDEAAKRGDFWRGLATAFRADPRRTDDEALNAIADLVGRDSTVLDVGGGAGRFAVALALGCAGVTVVDPSGSMLAQLREAVREAGVSNVSDVYSEWESADVEAADVALCSHVVYGVADIRPFIEKLIAHAREKVALVSFVDSPQAGVAPLWEPVYGERRVNLPALPELVNALWEMDVYPNVKMLTPSAPQTFETTDAATDEVASRLFIGDDADARRRLEDCIEDHLERAGDGYRIRGSRPVRQGVIWWEV